MKLLKILILISTILIANACGGGGGSTPPIDSNTIVSTNTGVGAIGLKANLTSVVTVALTSTTGAKTQTGLLRKVHDWIFNIVPSAFADSPKTINILGYDANGNAVENPLVANVNVYIAGVVSSPDGKEVYLFLDDNQNQTLYADYRALQGVKCILYKIIKDNGIVTCLMDSKYAISNPGRNGPEYGNRAEPYLKFDAAGNLYLMAYKPNGGGSAGHRLYKIPKNGSPEIVRDFVDEYYGQNVVYAKNGNLFYTEVDETKSSYKGRAFILDTSNSKFNQISFLDNQYIEKIATSLDGNVYLKVGSRIYRVNQVSFGVESISMNGGGEVLELTRSSAGGVYILTSSGNIMKIVDNTTKLISGVGNVTLEPNRNPDTDLYYQKMIVNSDWIVVRGSSPELAELDTTPAVCVINLSTFEKMCDTLKTSQPVFYSFAFIGDKLYTFFTSSGIFKQATVSVAKYFSGLESYVISDSAAGNGSVVSSISMRPPVSFVADLANVTTTTLDKLISISYPVPDSYTYLSFTGNITIMGITATDLGLTDSSGVSVDAKYTIVDNVIYAAIKDTTGKKSSGFQTLGSTNNYSLVFPSTYTVTDTYTSLTFTSVSNIVGITDTDLGLKDSTGAPVDANFKIVENVISVTVKDTSNIKPSGFKLLGSVNDYSLVFPSSYIPPAFTKGIGTKSGNFSVNKSSFAKGIGTKTGFFPVVQPSSILYLDFSAPVVNLDLSGLQLIDSTGAAVPSTISMAKEGMRLEIRVEDSNPSNLTGYKAMPTGSVYKLTLPSRVRLPGQTFLSPFDKTQIVFTTKS